MSKSEEETRLTREEENDRTKNPYGYRSSHNYTDYEKQRYDILADKIDNKVKNRDNVEDDSEDLTLEEMEEFVKLWTVEQCPGWAEYCLKQVNVYHSDDCLYK